ncbi:MAG TPA: hypothetical protein VKG92_08440 [Flavobacteriales bacterium]|nr:hypothetical protein [Flavobacteriales bacterium]
MHKIATALRSSGVAGAQAANAGDQMVMYFVRGQQDHPVSVPALPNPEIPS